MQWNAQTLHVTGHWILMDAYALPYTWDGMLWPLHKGPLCLFLSQKATSILLSKFDFKFSSVNLASFKIDYAEVEAGIEDLRELLLKKLLETPSTLHDQKRYIR